MRQPQCRVSNQDPLEAPGLKRQPGPEVIRSKWWHNFVKLLQSYTYSYGPRDGSPCNFQRGPSYHEVSKMSKDDHFENGERHYFGGDVRRHFALPLRVS